MNRNDVQQSIESRGLYENRRSRIAALAFIVILFLIQPVAVDAVVFLGCYSFSKCPGDYIVFFLLIFGPPLALSLYAGALAAWLIRMVDIVFFKEKLSHKIGKTKERLLLLFVFLSVSAIIFAVIWN